MHGMDPLELLGQGRDEHLISLAILNKTIEVSSKQKFEEYKILSQLTSYELAKILSKIL
jgi:hypothetical protein